MRERDPHHWLSGVLVARGRQSVFKNRLDMGMAKSIFDSERRLASLAIEQYGHMKKMKSSLEWGYKVVDNEVMCVASCANRLPCSRARWRWRASVDTRASMAVGCDRRSFMLVLACSQGEGGRRRYREAEGHRGQPRDDCGWRARQCAKDVRPRKLSHRSALRGGECVSVAAWAQVRVRVRVVDNRIESQQRPFSEATFFVGYFRFRRLP